MATIHRKQRTNKDTYKSLIVSMGVEEVIYFMDYERTVINKNIIFC